MRFKHIAVLLLVLLTACEAPLADRPHPSPVAGSTNPSSAPLSPTRSLEPPATPAINARDQSMYQTALDAFFQDGEVVRLLQPDLLRQKVLYIQPTFADTQMTIPSELIQIASVYATNRSLTLVAQEQAGGAMLTLSAIGEQPEAADVYHQRGPTIQIALFISGGVCGSSIAHGYLMTARDDGWQAQQYLTAVC